MSTPLADLLNGAIDKAVTDERTRETILAEIAKGSGTQPGMIDQILKGNLKSPELGWLAGFSEVLDLTIKNIIEVANKDGCNYEVPKDAPDKPKDAPDDKGGKKGDGSDDPLQNTDAKWREGYTVGKAASREPMIAEHEAEKARIMIDYEEQLESKSKAITDADGKIAALEIAKGEAEAALKKSQEALSTMTRGMKFETPKDVPGGDPSDFLHAIDQARERGMDEGEALVDVRRNHKDLYDKYMKETRKGLKTRNEIA